MLLRYHSNSGVFEFVEQSTTRLRHDPTFTIVVGKNGTGKSRLLSAVVHDLLRRYGGASTESRRGFDHHGEVEHTYPPTRVVCVSTSPFDRFPLPSRHEASTYYSYLGLRGLPSQHLGAAYLGRVMATLLDAIEERPAQARALAGILRYLQYDEHLEATFQLIPGSLLKILAGPHPAQALDDYSQRPMMSMRENLQPLRQLLDLPLGEYRHLVEVALAVSQAKSRRFRVAITPNGLDYGGDLVPRRLDFVKLARYGLIRLRETRFFKNYEPVSMNELSSGEQAVMMSLLGIGSQICDGALICIDEPEVCLHPEWQARYIELLYRTFSSYQGCHFVIATHSPQVVAHLPPGNCHVTSMETGVSQHSATYAGRSIDFQLARLFQAPGHRNEYLTRVAVNLFTRATQSKRFDAEDEEELAMLEDDVAHTDRSDPLRELVSALSTMRAAYG